MKRHYKPKIQNVTKLKSYLDRHKTIKDERSKRHNTGRNS